MTPDHETDTLEGLGKRWREIAAKPIIPAHDRPGQIGNIAFQIGQEVYTKCADELAPILAGLREMRNSLASDPGVRHYVIADQLDKWLGYPATADQTGAGNGEEK